MPEDGTPAPEGQVPEGEQPQVGTPNEAPVEGQVPNTRTFTADYVQGIRQEAASYRNEVKSLKDTLKALNDERLTALQAQEARMRDLSLKAEVAAFAAEQGITKVDTLLKLAKADVEYDDQGSPKNLSDVLAKVLEDLPELAKKGTPPGTPPAAPKPGLPANPPKGGVTPTHDPRKVSLFDPDLWDEQA